VCGRRAGRQNVTDVVQQERFAARYKYFGNAKRGRFTSDPPYPIHAEGTSRRLRRRANTTIVTAQIAIEIGVEPKPRPKGTRGFHFYRRFAAPDDPSVASPFKRRFDQTITGEATPSFEFGTDRSVRTSNCHEIARLCATKRSNHFHEQAGSKPLGASIEFDIGSHCHGRYAIAA
jgi:hypothetical protein